MLEAWDLPSLLPVKFLPPLMGTLAPGCHPQMTSAPHPNLGLHCIRTSCQSRPPSRAVVIVGSARWPCRAWEKQSNFSGQLSRPEAGREEAAASSPAPGSDAGVARCPAQPCGMKRNLAGAGGPSAPPRLRGAACLTWLSPLSPRCSASLHTAATCCRPFFGSLAGIFRLAPHHFP